MELWYTERQTEAYGVTMRVTETLESTQTAFQRLAMVKTEQWGNMLVLDGMVMTTEQDEFVYHEMMTHPALMTHPCPKDVLVVGGGDGGVIREVLKHPSVERAVLVEIDEEVVLVSKEHLPTIAGSLSDPRVHVICGDGYMHIAQQRAAYDVILVDSTEPVGPAVELFTRGFYQGISEALRPDGLFVAQSDNPWFKADLIRNVARDVADIFEIRRVYTANIPTYPSGLWTFTMGSKQYDPLRVERSSIRDIATKYYTPDVHYGAFALPRFVAALLED